jgi:hypothetical protein
MFNCKQCKSKQQEIEAIKERISKLETNNSISVATGKKKYIYIFGAPLEVDDTEEITLQRAIRMIMNHLKIEIKYTSGTESKIELTKTSKAKDLS